MSSLASTIMIPVKRPLSARAKSSRLSKQTSNGSSSASPKLVKKSKADQHGLLPKDLTKPPRVNPSGRRHSASLHTESSGRKSQSSSDRRSSLDSGKESTEFMKSPKVAIKETLARPMPQKRAKGKTAKRAGSLSKLLEAEHSTGIKKAATRPVLERKISNRGRLTQSCRELTSSDDLQSVVTEDSLSKQRALKATNDTATHPVLERKTSSRGRLTRSSHRLTSSDDLQSVMTDDSFSKKGASKAIRVATTRPPLFKSTSNLTKRRKSLQGEKDLKLVESASSTSQFFPTSSELHWAAPCFEKTVYKPSSARCA